MYSKLKEPERKSPTRERLGREKNVGQTQIKSEIGKQKNIGKIFLKIKVVQIGLYFLSKQEFWSKYSLSILKY